MGSFGFFEIGSEVSRLGQMFILIIHPDTL